MRNPFYRLILIIFSSGGSDRITSAEILGHIRYLSSDPLKGRAPGTSGSKKAIRYIEKEWKISGVIPAGEKGYQQSFEFTSGVSFPVIIALR